MKKKTNRAIVLGIVALGVILAILWLWLKYPNEEFDYEVVELGSLGGSAGAATALNNVGQVVGWYEVNFLKHAFIWDANQGMRGLGTLGGWRSMASGINDRGQVVGWAKTAEGPVHAFVWEPEAGMTDLGTLGGSMSMAMAINNKGQIVGFSKTTEDQTHAFIWDANQGMRDLGTLGGGNSYAYGINDKGEVVGRGFYWDRVGGMVDIAVPHSHGAVPCINNAGQVAGIFLHKNKDMDVFIWEKGAGVKSLGLSGVAPLRLWPVAVSVKMNDSGEIIGRQKKPEIFHIGASWYFLRTRLGRVIKLNKYGRSESEQIAVSDINNDGSMAGMVGSPGSVSERPILLKRKWLLD
ncbi:MAG: hypothetical protein FVQ85_08490 [Planctomycetes bacterium]|nr:hypothetical protein [Planctomycetota bacterium]